MAKQKGYRQFCPVAKAAEVVAERWTLLVLRELVSGCERFNDIRRGVPMMSPSLLSQRLKELERAGVISRHAVEGQKGYSYRLTEAGEEMQPIIEALGVWGLRWTNGLVEDSDLDPGLLMWDMRRGILTEKLPEGRTVLEFDFGAKEKKRRYWWLVVDNGEVDLCLKFPGYEVDALITTSVETLADCWLRKRDPKEAVTAGEIQIDGTRTIEKGFATWLGMSAIAQATADR